MFVCFASFFCSANSRKYHCSTSKCTNLHHFLDLVLLKPNIKCVLGEFSLWQIFVKNKDTFILKIFYPLWHMLSHVKLL